MEVHREVRFYICLVLGFVLLICGFYTDPPGEISKSVLVAFGCFLCVGAVSVGVDIRGILHEIVLIKQLYLREALKEDDKNQ